MIGKRPALHEIPLPVELKPGAAFMTIDEGAWDMLIKAAYERGWTLLEMDEDEKPV